ncbi:hypothetical protein E6O75_ATG04778 [Venturia nashicola]|uniref:Uncharacterized protein n=1 Tax=Venturia nashicola TaxID=86259 RepID=A0A4Z1P1U4_9PEZI|nr:hypothetical protein E6O75_ATG04778 [Venturia nashicola]
MKGSSLLCASLLSTAASAWQVEFHTRSNIGLTMHGTRSDGSCKTIGWNHGNTKEDVNWLKFIFSFDPATDNWPDPKKVTVYPGQLCGAGGIPDFAKPIPHPSLDDQLEPNSERCAKAFDICTRFLVPTLGSPRLMDEAFFRPFRYCYRTWRDGAVPFRHELIETAKCWQRLGLVGSCPFPTPKPKELAVHQEEYQRFVAAQELKSNLSSLLNTASDGWAPPEDWKTVKKAHKEMFDGTLQAVLGNESLDDDEPIRDEEDLREIWPFDL